MTRVRSRPLSSFVLGKMRSYEDETQYPIPGYIREIVRSAFVVICAYLCLCHFSITKAYLNQKKSGCSRRRDVKEKQEQE